MRFGRTRKRRKDIGSRDTKPECEEAGAQRILQGRRDAKRFAVKQDDVENERDLEANKRDAQHDRSRDTQTDCQGEET